MSRRSHDTVETTGQAAQRARALLQIWLSPSFPVGSFAYSHGLEKAVEAGWVRDRATLEAWLSDLIAHGSLANDLILCASAQRAAAASDWPALQAIAQLSIALQPSAERHLEATQQGLSFLQQIDAAWPANAVRACEAFADERASLPVALGFAAAAHVVPPADALAALAVAFIGNLTSAAIRLSVIGQTDAQRITAALLPAMLDASRDANTRELKEIASAAFRNDIASMQHETQTTRLFRS